MAAHQCQHCGSQHLRRSRRHSFVELAILPLFLVRPYRCSECHTRQYGIGFHRFRSRASNTLLLTLLLAAALTAILGSTYVILLILLR